jgi:hypothetical protein
MSRKENQADRRATALRMKVAGVASVAALVAAGFGLAASGVANAEPQPVNACGIVGDITVTPLQSDRLFVDTANGVEAQYLGFKVTTAVALDRPAIQLTGSDAISVVDAANGADRQWIGSLAAGSESPAYFLVQPNVADRLTPTTITVSVNSYANPLDANQVQQYTCDYTLEVEDSHLANPATDNQIKTVRVNEPEGRQIGQYIGVVTQGSVNGLGLDDTERDSLDNLTGPYFLSATFTPVANGSWPASKVALRNVVTNFYTDQDGVECLGPVVATVNNKLSLTEADIAPAVPDAVKCYQTTATFEVLGRTDGPVALNSMLNASTGHEGLGGHQEEAADDYSHNAADPATINTRYYGTGPVTPPAPPVVTPSPTPTPTPTPTPSPTPTPKPEAPVIKTIPGFAPGSYDLTSSMRASLSKFVTTHPSYGTVLCTGFTMGPVVTPVDKALALNRARVSCAYIKKLNPGLTVKSTTGVTQTAVGDAVRRVTVKLTNSK